MSEQGFDSTNAGDVEAARPAAGSVIFGYGNGAYAWSEEDWSHFPADEYRRVIIDVYIPGQDCSELTGDLLDVEAGYIAPDSPNRADALNQAHNWTTRHRAAGKIPGWYTSASARAELEPVVGAGAWLLGDWTGAEHQDAGEDVIGTQYGSPTVPAPGEGHWDVSDINSAAFDPWYEHNHPTGPAETGSPLSQLTQEETVKFILKTTDTNREYLCTGVRSVAYLQNGFSGGDLSTLEVVECTQADVDNIARGYEPAAPTQ